jgi:hypothetical protein
MTFYLVYFSGDTLHAFTDWFAGTKSIQTSGPYENKSDAINASLGRARACIVYHAENQIILHSQQGYTAQSINELLFWAKSNIKFEKTKVIKNDNMISSNDEKKDWALSKIKKISHSVDMSEFHIAVDSLSKLITATVSGMVGNIPGILQAVSGLTLDICHGSEEKKENEHFIKEIEDNDGNKGILVLKALSETKLKKKFWGQDKKKLYISGIICVLIPLTEKAKQQCIEIQNQHASNVLEQVEKEFLFVE